MPPNLNPDEEPLRAMTEQLIIIGSKLYDLEILLLETSGCFQNKDERKISFDDIKGMFALLAMSKTIADRFSYASVELFQKLKLYPIQASDKATHYLRLWPIQYVSNGTYRFNREDKTVIMEDKSQVQQVLTPLLYFFFYLTSLTETSDLLQQLKLQDEENKSFNKDSNSQQTLLSDIICPKIFRLTYNKYGKGFGRQPINSSSESG
ncbi:hypothetical protein BDF21DRAFT_440876 [Thamnidium elegans]|nr:hypothetical protein BDF21DRAFT_440876 [Thamnidium elegans]